MPNCDWRALIAAARTGLTVTAYAISAGVLLYGLYLWGYDGLSAHAKGQKPEIHCSYAQRDPSNAKSPNPPIIVYCLQAPAYAENDRAGNPAQDEYQGPVALSKSVARKIVSDPIALFTLVLAFLTLGLIVVGSRQHEAAVKALGAARDSAEAAKLSAEALPTAERAYLFPNVRLISVSPNGTDIVLALNAINAGKTPAIMKRYFINKLANEPTGGIRYRRTQTAKHGNSELVISANKGSETDFCTIDVDITKTPFIICQLRYIDIFKKLRYARYSIKLQGAGDYIPAGTPGWNDWK